MKLKRYLAALLYFVFAMPSYLFGEVKVGVILPYSGEFAKFGEVIRRGVESGKAEQIQALYEDEACLPMSAVRAYTKLAQVDNVQLFIGPGCGSPQMAVAPLLGRNKHLSVLGSAAPEEVYRASKGWMLSAQHSLEAESRFVAREMNERQIKSVVVLFHESDFGRTHEAAFRSTFKGEVRETIAFNSRDLTVIRAAALKVKKLGAQAIFAPDAFPLMLGLTKELLRIDAGSIPIWSVYSVQSESVREAVGDDEVTIVYSYPDIGDEDALEFFPKKAMEMLSAASESCGEKPECISKFLKSRYPFNEKGYVDGELVLKTLQAGKFVPYKGA